MDGGSLAPRKAEYRQKTKHPRMFPVSYNKVLKNQPTNCAPRTRCTAVRTAAAPLYCCMLRFGRWVGVGCTASSVVGGWAVPYVGVFFRPVGDEPFFCFYNKISASHSLVLGSATVPTAALLCPLLPCVLLHCRTAALLLFCNCSPQTQRIAPLLM